MTSKIKTFKAACKFRKLDPVKCLPDVSGMPADMQASTTAYCKLIIVIEALNAESNAGKVWVPDWDNYNEYKYMPYFKMSSKGFVFYYYADSYFTYSHVGSRLCFRTRELAEYAAKQAEFKKLYKDYMLMM